MAYPFAALIVEDQRTTALIVAKLMSRIGFEHVDCVPDGAAALAAMDETPYGLVISDWHMKPMSGIALLRAVRQEPRFRGVRFIMTSVDWSPESIVQSREAGADGFMLKPFNARMLKERIDGVLEGARTTVRRALAP